MPNIKQLPPPQSLPLDLPAKLRAMADDIEKGRVTEFVAGLVYEDTYQFVLASPLRECLVLSALMNATVLKKYGME